MSRKWVITAIVVGMVAIGGAGLWWAHEQPFICATCHNIRPYYESWSSSSLLDNAHAKAEVRCLDCHPFDPVESAMEAVTYATGAYEDPLDERLFSEEMCIQCHTQQKLSEAPYPEGRNPHVGHEGETAEIPCGVCHNAHRPSVDYCAECHPPTASDAWTLPEATSENHPLELEGDHGSLTCFQCHDRPDFQDLVGYACENCHPRPHPYGSSDCRDCHSLEEWEAISFQAGAHIFPIDHAGIEGNCIICHPREDYTRYTCFACHLEAYTIEQHADQDFTDIVDNCTACHPAQAP
jgi:hypothetical protein